MCDGHASGTACNPAITCPGGHRLLRDSTVHIILLHRKGTFRRQGTTPFRSAENLEFPQLSSSTSRQEPYISIG